MCARVASEGIRSGEVTGCDAAFCTYITAILEINISVFFGTKLVVLKLEWTL